MHLIARIYRIKGLEDRYQSVGQPPHGSAGGFRVLPKSWTIRVYTCLGTSCLGVSLSLQLYCHVLMFGLKSMHILTTSSSLNISFCTVCLPADRHALVSEFLHSCKIVPSQVDIPQTSGIVGRHPSVYQLCCRRSYSCLLQYLSF